jgi:hypothetical protein
MDNDGCEKCYLWGKLQILGLGTTLKIHFSMYRDKYVGQPLNYSEAKLFH